jgi:hypothetical protein
MATDRHDELGTPGGLLAGVIVALVILALVIWFLFSSL